MNMILSTDMGSSQTLDTITEKAHPNSPVVLADLDRYELESIGQSLIGLPAPDLSMFVPEQRKEILEAAVEHFEALLGTKYKHYGIETALAPHVVPLIYAMEREKGCKFYHSDDVLVRSFKDPVARARVFASLGKHESALKEVGKAMHLRDRSYSLDFILSLHEEAIGRTANEQEFRQLSQYYFFHSGSFDAVSGFVNEHKKRELPIKFDKGTALSSILRIVDSYLASRSSDPKFPEEQGKASYQFLISLIAPECYTSTARKAVRQGNLHVAEVLTVMGYQKKDSSGQKQLSRQERKELVALQHGLMQKGLFAPAYIITKQLETPFDFDAVFAYVQKGFKPSYRAKPHRTEMPQYPVPPSEWHPSLQSEYISAEILAVMPYANKRQLKKYESAMWKTIGTVSPSSLQEPSQVSEWLPLYNFALAVSGALKYKRAARKTKELFSQLENRQQAFLDALRDTPEPAQSNADDIKPPETKSLKDILLTDPNYIIKAHSAYLRKGLFGIRDITQKWAQRYDSSTLSIDWSLHPAHMLHGILLQRNLNLIEYVSAVSRERVKNEAQALDPSAKRILDKALMDIASYEAKTGEQLIGFGGDPLYLVDSGRVGGRKPVGLESSIFHPLDDHYGDGSKRIAAFALDGEHHIKKLGPGSVVPEKIYRIAAAEHLRAYSDEWTGVNERAARHGPTQKIEQPSQSQLESAHQNIGLALHYFRQIQEPGLLAFMQKNFGNVRE